jgi:hypothetical protein
MRVPARYVWPDVLVASETVNSPIILASAPGAMGKSMAARAVAASLDAAFIDLSRLSVGSDTLTGLLARVLGWQQTPDLIRDLRSGKSTLVLDGLDEAQLRAGREHTIAFLRNIVELVKGAESLLGQIVIFGRGDSIETSYLVFGESGITPFMATIAPMTLPQANELINLELDAKEISGKAYEVHRVHALPFAELRDKLFIEIADALGAEVSSGQHYWESVEDFLGYPPVLLVFAEHLVVENPSAELSEMRFRLAGEARIQHGELLRKIVEGILDRESSKVRGQLAKALSLSPQDPKCMVLYTREEQLLRILNHVSDYLNLDLVPPAVLTGTDRTIYEEQISTFIPDHPFLRGRKFANVVFADYVRAYVAVGPQMDAYGGPKAEILQACPAVGPFFAELVYSFLLDQNQISKSDGISEAVLQGEDLIDDLVTSYYLGRIVGEAHFFYSHTPKKSNLILFGAEEGSDSVFFRVENPSGVLELTTPLMHGIIISQHGLVLKSLSDEIEIGPNLAIFVGELEIVGRKLTVLGGGRSSDFDRSRSMIAAMNHVQHDPSLNVSSYPENSLRIAWTKPWHMWRPFMVPDSELPDMTPGALAPPIKWQVMVGIRRILTSFRGTDHNPSANKERLDHYGTAANPLFVAILDALIQLGIVERSGTIYRLHLGVLGDYGVNYAAVRSADFSGTLAKLTAQLGGMEVVKFAIRDMNG